MNGVSSRFEWSLNVFVRCVGVEGKGRFWTQLSQTIVANSVATNTPAPQFYDYAVIYKPAKSINRNHHERSERQKP